MNVAFWGQKHQCGTTAHAMAAEGMLRVLCGEERVVTGCFLREARGRFAICDCGTGFRGRRRHFLWHADLVVVNLKQEKQCIEAFFGENFHIAKNMMFLLSEYDCKENIETTYLNGIYRVAKEQVGMIPYNMEFCQALENGTSDAFIRKEYYAPTSLANEQFICSVYNVVAAMLRGTEYEL